MGHSLFARNLAFIGFAFVATSLHAQSPASSSEGGDWKKTTSCGVATPQGSVGAALMAQPWCAGIKGVGTAYDKKFKLPPPGAEKTLELEIEDLHTQGEQCFGKAKHLLDAIQANSAPELKDTKGAQATHLAEGAIDNFQQALDKDKDAVKSAGDFLDQLTGAQSADLAACQKEKAKDDCIKVCTAWGGNVKKTLETCKSGQEAALPIIQEDLDGAKSLLKSLQTMLAHGDGKDENAAGGSATTPQIIGGVGTGAGSGSNSDGSNNLVTTGSGDASGLGDGALDGSEFASDDGTVSGGRGLASGGRTGWGGNSLFSDPTGGLGSGSGSDDNGLGSDGSGSGGGKAATYTTAGTGALGGGVGAPAYDFSGGAGKGLDGSGKGKLDGDTSGPQNFMYVKKKRKATKAQRAELEAAAVKALNVQNVSAAPEAVAAPAPKAARAPVPTAGGLQRK